MELGLRVGLLLLHFAVLAAVHGSLGLPGWRLFRGFTLLSPIFHSSPSLIGLLASVDVKQQSISLMAKASLFQSGNGWTG